MVMESDLLARIEGLERQNQRLRQMALLGFVLVLAVGAIGVDLLLRRGDETSKTADIPGDSLAVRELVIRDESGQTRAILGSDADGTRLRLYDGEGRRRASLALTADGLPGLAFFDGEEANRAVFEMREQGARIVLVDGKGRVQFSRP